MLRTMHWPDLPDFPSRELSANARAYHVTADTELAAFHVEAALPHAPGGFVVYTWLARGRQVGAWNWARDAAALEPVMRAYRIATDPAYVPPDWRAPGGEAPRLRPPDRDMVQRAIDEARPDRAPSRSDIIPIRRDLE